MYFCSVSFPKIYIFAPVSNYNVLILFLLPLIRSITHIVLSNYFYYKKTFQCGKSFAAQEVLSRHVKTHLKIKPIACYECGETFIQASQLRSHMFYHNNENGFKCEQCNKLFSKKSKYNFVPKYIQYTYNIFIYTLKILSW